MEPEGYMSFLVRLWRDQSDNDRVGWCGEIEHIQSGARWSFSTIGALLVFLHQTVAAPHSATPPLLDEP
jgi:hypothetical protein